MPIGGFNFDKINIERTGEGIVKGKGIDIKNNMGITEMSAIDIPMDKGTKAIKFDFEFSVSYDPKIAILDLQGHVVYVDEEKKTENLLKQWKKDKSIPVDVMEPIMNSILYRCNVKALALTQEMSLPPHIRLPRIKTQVAGKDVENKGKDEKGYIG